MKKKEPDTHIIESATGKYILDYNVKFKLGEGPSGIYYITKDQAGKTCVVKLCKNKNALAALKLDAIIEGSDHSSRINVFAVEALNSCTHTVKILEYGNLEGGQPFIITEHCDNGNLMKLIQNRALQVVKSLEILVQLSEGLLDIHSRGLMHRDLCPQNIFISGTTYKIGGFESISNKKNEKGQIGNEQYSAPEMIGKHSYTNKVDIYSLGLIFASLLRGHEPPFKNDEFGKFKDRVQDLLSGMMIDDPDQRFTAAKVYEIAESLHQSILSKMNKPQETKNENNSKLNQSYQVDYKLKPTSLNQNPITASSNSKPLSKDLYAGIPNSANSGLPNSTIIPSNNYVIYSDYIPGSNYIPSSNQMYANSGENLTRNKNFEPSNNMDFSRAGKFNEKDKKILNTSEDQNKKLPNKPRIFDTKMDIEDPNLVKKKEAIPKARQDFEELKTETKFDSYAMSSSQGKKNAIEKVNRKDDAKAEEKPSKRSNSGNLYAGKKIIRPQEDFESDEEPKNNNIKQKVMKEMIKGKQFDDSDEDKNKGKKSNIKKIKSNESKNQDPPDYLELDIKDVMPNYSKSDPKNKKDPKQTAGSYGNKDREKGMEKMLRDNPQLRKYLGLEDNDDK